MPDLPTFLDTKHKECQNRFSILSCIFWYQNQWLDSKGCGFQQLTLYWISYRGLRPFPHASKLWKFGKKIPQKPQENHTFLAKPESGLGNGFGDMGAIGHVQFVSRLMHMTSALISTAFGEERRLGRGSRRRKLFWVERVIYYIYYIIYT